MPAQHCRTFLARLARSRSLRHFLDTVPTHHVLAECAQAARWMNLQFTADELEEMVRVKVKQLFRDGADVHSLSEDELDESPAQAGATYLWNRLREHGMMGLIRRFLGPRPEKRLSAQPQRLAFDADHTVVMTTNEHHLAPSSA